VIPFSIVFVMFVSNSADADNRCILYTGNNSLPSQCFVKVMQ